MRDLGGQALAVGQADLAWQRRLVPLAGFLILATITGAQYSFAVFYLRLLEQFGWSRASMSSVLSVAMIAEALSTPLAGRLIDRFRPRRMVILGAGLVAAGYSLSALVSRPWHLYLSLGVLVPMGAPYLKLSVGVALTEWWQDRRGAAFGLAYAGIGVGELVMFQVTDAVLRTADWRTAYLVLAAVTLAVLVGVALLALRDPPRAPTSGAAGRAGGLTVADALRDRRFWVLAFGNLGIGVYTEAVYQHLIPHAVNLGHSTSLAVTALTVTAACFVVGQVAGGVWSDRIGRRVALSAAASVVAVAIVVAAWLAASTVWLFVAAGLSGLGIGATIAVRTAAWSDVFEGRHLGAITGLLFPAYPIGGSLINWAGGYVFDRTGTYVPTLGTAAFVAVVCAAMIFSLTPRARAYPAGASP